MKRKVLFFLGLTFLVGISACDDEFNPITGDLIDRYSVFGYVDADLDTQWVRVMPIRETIEVFVDTIEATVTLTEVGGQSYVMNPKSYLFRGSTGDTVKIWNYWTVADIDYQNTYEVSVEDPDGAKTYVVVDTPADFDQPVVNGNYIDFAYIDTLADVRLDWTVRNNVTAETRSFSFSHVKGVEVRNQGFSTVPIGYRAIINPNENFLRIAILMGYPEEGDAYLAALNNELEVLRTEATIVAAGDDWVDFGRLDNEEIAVQSTQANVVNGVGYMVGTVSKVFPFLVCVSEIGEMVACNPEL